MHWYRQYISWKLYSVSWQDWMTKNAMKCVLRSGFKTCLLRIKFFCRSHECYYKLDQLWSFHTTEVIKPDVTVLNAKTMSPVLTIEVYSTTYEQTVKNALINVVEQHRILKEVRCYEVKIEESEKGRQPPGVEPRTPLAWAASALPLSYDSWTTTNTHNPLYILHRWYWMPQLHTWQPLSMCRQNSVIYRGLWGLVVVRLELLQ